MGAAPIFSGTVQQDGSILLKAALTSVSDFQGRCCRDCPTFFATTFVLPHKYIVYDHLQFEENADLGFGPGVFRINTKSVTDLKNKELNFVRKTLAVENRPGAFYKIKNYSASKAQPNSVFHEDCMIFGPAQADGLFHKPVAKGEIFVFFKSGLKVTPELLQDVFQSFNDLFDRRSYKGNNNDLVSTEDNKIIEEHINFLSNGSRIEMNE